MRVRYDLTRVLASNEDLPRHFIERNSLGTCHLDRAIERRPERDLGKLLDDFVRHDRPHERRR